MTCEHGIKEFDKFESYAELIDGYCTSLVAKENEFKMTHEYSPETMIALVRMGSIYKINFLSNPDNQKYFDEKMLQVCWARTAQLILSFTSDNENDSESFEEAANYANIGIHIEAWLNCGKSKLINLLRRRGRDRSDNLDKYLHNPQKRIQTRRDLSIFISERIPCDCLDSFRAIKKTQICQACSKEGRKDVELRRCSACRVAAYCSRECQKADWKMHKKVCAQMAEAKEAKFLK